MFFIEFDRLVFFCRYVGPFSTRQSAERWLEENDRTAERSTVNELNDPGEAMYGLARFMGGKGT